MTKAKWELKRDQLVLDLEDAHVHMFFPDTLMNADGFDVNVVSGFHAFINGDEDWPHTEAKAHAEAIARAAFERARAKIPQQPKEGFFDRMSTDDMFNELCRLRGQWGLAVSVQDDFELGYAASAKACPSLTLEEYLDGGAFYFFESEELCRLAFDTVVGDDGPTRLNSYSGSARVYAVMVNPQGKPVHENT